MAQANTDNITSRPVDSTRRRFLSQAAGVAAGGAALTLATVPATAAAAPTGSLAQSEADPIFALIARHRAEQEAYGEALVAREHGVTANDRDEQLCHSCHELGWALANTTPTSLAGVAAVLRYVNEFEDRGEEWPDTDTIGSDGWHYQLRQTAARALETPLS